MSRPLSLPILLLLLFVALPPTSRTQQLDSLTDARRASLSRVSLHPLPDGTWIGFEVGSVATRLVRFDSRFDETAQALWGGFRPLAFGPHVRTTRRDSAGLILGITRNRTTLYEVDYGTLRLTPLWEPEVELGPLDRLLTIAERGLLLYGPGGAAFVDTSYRVVSRIGTELLTAPHSIGHDSVLIIHRDIAGVHLLRASVENLDAGSESTIGPGTTDIVVAVRHAIAEIGSGERPTPTRTRIGIAIRANRSVHLLTPDGRSLGRTPLPPAWTDLLGLTGGPEPELIEPLGIDISYPGPRLVATNHPDGHPLYYPLASPPVGLVSFGDYHLLHTADSVVLYRSNFEWLGSHGVAIGEDPRFFSIDSTDRSVLVSSTAGTYRLSLRPEPIDWIREYGPLVGLFLAALLLLIASVIVIERYRRMRAIFRALVTGSGAAGVMIFSKRTRLLRVNRQALELLGLPESTPLGRHILTYFQSAPLHDLRDDLRTHLRDGAPVDRQIALGEEAGSRTVRVLLRRMTGRYGSRRGTLLIVEDLTETVERDRLLNWASVAHHIAHEMKTPLGTIRTSADILRGELLGSGAGDIPLSMLGRIIRQSGRLREIVEDLLTVARSDTLILNRVDLAVLLHTLADDLREFMPETCRITIESGSPSVVIRADADQLAVAIRNILDNARQAIGHRENGLITCRLATTGSTAVIAIADNGIGMSEETRSRLFQPFYSEKEGGSGIGTTIMKRVIEGHGGKIEVESSPGEGSTFRVILPFEPERREEVKEDRT